MKDFSLEACQVETAHYTFYFLHAVFVLQVNCPEQGIGQPGTYIAAVCL